MFTSFNLVKNFFITVEYDIKICLFWAGFFPGVFNRVFKVGLPKKTHRVFLGTCPGVRTLPIDEHCYTSCAYANSRPQTM